MNRRIAAILAAVVLAIAGTTVTAQPAHADGWGHSANIYAENHGLTVCHNWGSTTCASGVAWLPVHKATRSYLGWQDADGVYVSPGCAVKANAWAYGYRWLHQGWNKLPGGPWIVWQVWAYC